MPTKYTGHDNTVSVSYMGKHTHTCIYASICEDLGEVWIQSEDPLLLIPLLLHPSTLSGFNPTPHYPISTPHPAGVPAHTAWQCQLSARETTGGMWGLGPEITKRLKIDPGNGDVAFPSPLTSNPSHICVYCLVCFTRWLRLCGLRRMRML